MALVLVARFADAGLEVDARALLHHVRGLVRRRVQIGRTRERDVAPRRVRRSSHRLCRRGGVRAEVGLHPAHVVTPEQLLDATEVREAPGAPRDAALRRGLHPRGIGLGGREDPPLHRVRRRLEGLGQRALAGHALHRAGARVLVEGVGVGAVGPAEQALVAHTASLMNGKTANDTFASAEMRITLDYRR